jgi:hypothetical protein
MIHLLDQTIAMGANRPPVRRRSNRSLTVVALMWLLTLRDGSEPRWHTGQPVSGPGTGNTNAWFNPAAFATPAAYTFGNVGRNTIYGPGMQTLDIAMTRSFAVVDRMRLEMRAEAYNALNHSNWGTPNRFVNTPQFGSITEATTPGREFQLSARLSF